MLRMNDEANPDEPRTATRGKGGCFVLQEARGRNKASVFFQAINALCISGAAPQRLRKQFVQ